jgi:hypothetical protein
MTSTLTDPAYRAFVLHLVAERGRLRISQGELAQGLAKHQSYVSKTERFERRLDPAEFRAFALALGLDPVEAFAAVHAALTAAADASAART